MELQGYYRGSTLVAPLSRKEGHKKRKWLYSGLFVQHPKEVESKLISEVLEDSPSTSLYCKTECIITASVCKREGSVCRKKMQCDWRAIY